MTGFEEGGHESEIRSQKTGTIGASKESGMRNGCH